MVVERKYKKMSIIFKSCCDQEDQSLLLNNYAFANVAFSNTIISWDHEPLFAPSKSLCGRFKNVPPHGTIPYFFQSAFHSITMLCCLTTISCHEMVHEDHNWIIYIFKIAL